MEYTPQQEREIRNSMVLTPGEYDFEVADAKEATSKKGNEMIELSIRVFPHDGSGPRLVRDWLVGGTSLGELKINRFCHSIGQEEVYFAGDLTSLTCNGGAGRCKVTITSSEQYGDQNAIRDYLPRGVANDSEQPSAEAIGVPASQTKRALKHAHANDELSQAAYEDQLAKANDDIPF